jgi:ketosteroid isomerase-like protein
MTGATEHNKVSLAKEYFARLDAGSPALLELFTEDAQIYFPKFGIGRGRQAILEVLSGLGSTIQSVQHPSDSFVYIQSGNYLAVEGTSRGVLKSGAHWAAGETPGGRFCNVFEFRGDLICRVHIYLDPDYGGADTQRFLWGERQQSW